jgi:hypothetical protein
LSKSEHKICEDYISLEYSDVKEVVASNGDIICQQIGTFSQDTLISFVSLLEHQMIQFAESKTIQNRLIYLVIECVQNIMFHSEKLPESHQLAYLIVSKNSKGYSIHTSNSVKSENIPGFVEKIDSLLAVKKKSLPDLFLKKIKKHELDSKGHAGLGLLTIIDKTGKNFNYKVSEMTSNYSLFHLEIDLKTK